MRQPPLTMTLTRTLELGELHTVNTIQILELIVLVVCSLCPLSGLLNIKHIDNVIISEASFIQGVINNTHYTHELVIRLEIIPKHTPMTSIAVHIRRLGIFRLTINLIIVHQSTIVTYTVDCIVIVVDIEPVFTVLCCEHSILNSLVNTTKTHEIYVVSSELIHIKIIPLTILTFTNLCIRIAGLKALHKSSIVNNHLVIGCRGRIIIYLRCAKCAVDPGSHTS